MPLLSFCLTGLVLKLLMRFCIVIDLLVREHKRKTFDFIQNFGAWQATVLVVMGFLGG